MLPRNYDQTFLPLIALVAIAFAEWVPARKQAFHKASGLFWSVAFLLTSGRNTKPNHMIIGGRISSMPPHSDRAIAGAVWTGPDDNVAGYKPAYLERAKQDGVD